VKDRLLDSSFGFADVLGLLADQKGKFTEPEYREAVLCASE
jgi:hypothetical protein